MTYWAFGVYTMAKTTQLRPKQRVNEMFEAFNGRDLEAVLDLLADDIGWLTPVNDVNSKDAFRTEVWEPFMEMLDEMTPHGQSSQRPS